MGSVVHFSACLLVCFLLSSICGVPAIRAQDLREMDALCNDHGCYVVYFQRKTFLDSWKACKDNGGNLATIKRAEEADTIAALLSGADLRHSRTAVRLWIGLQRQPRQCKPSRPLRGYSWTTGDQDTEYTNWRREDSPGSCSTPRCVAMGYDSSPPGHSHDTEWLDGSCFVPVDGYLCRYMYKGMCPALWSEGGGDALYTTPFNLLTTLLTHLPFGSVATVPCPAGTKKEQSVLCMSKENGAVGWSRDGPLCANDGPISQHPCGQDKGGCDHFCREAGDQHYCQCSEGFQLADDGQNCEIIDVCLGAPCESECLPLSDGYRCACPEGYMLAPDERGCLDVDECLQSPCEQLCVNSPGTFECRCREGYGPADESECEDVDECMNDPCEQACENTPGSHVCHCHMGFSVSPEDHSHCQETDECQIPGTCQQMCVNYVGGFDCYCEEGYELGADHYTCQKTDEGDGRPTVTPDLPWVTHQPGPPWNPDFFHWQRSQTDWPDSLDWLTDPPRVQSSDVIWVTSGPQVEMPFHISIDASSQQPEGEPFQNAFQWEVTPKPSTHTPPPTTTTITTTTPPPTTTTTTTTTPPPTTTTTTTIHTPPPTTTTTTTTTHTPPPTTTTTTHTTRPTTPSTHTTPLTTSPTPTPDWSEDGEDQTTAGVSTPPSLTTISEGASNWLWVSTTPAGHQSVTTEYENPIVDYNISSDSNFHGEEEKDVDYNSISDFLEEPTLTEKEDNGEGLDHLANVLNITSTSGRGPATEKQATNTWLLVGLLVPICIFVVVMVALGVVYCTRCGVEPRTKSTSDCYHWISGAHHKPAQSSAAAGKAHV